MMAVEVNLAADKLDANGAMLRWKGVQNSKEDCGNGASEGRAWGERREGRREEQGRKKQEQCIYVWLPQSF